MKNGYEEEDGPCGQYRTYICFHMHVRGGSKLLRSLLCTATYTTCPMAPRYIRYLHQKQLRDKLEETKHTLVVGLNITLNLQHFPPPALRISVSKHCIGQYHTAIFNPPPRPLQKQSTKSINTRESDRVLG